MQLNSLKKLDRPNQVMTSPQSYALNEAGEVIGLNLNDGNLRDADLAEIWKNTKLQALNLSQNRLAKVSIPKELNQLRYLNLSQNEGLQEIHFEAGLPSLERLEIAGCVLRQIHLPRGFHCLKALFLQKTNSNRGSWMENSLNLTSLI